MAQIFTCGTLMNFKHQHIKDITIRKDQHTQKMGMLWERQQVSQKRIALQIHRYCTWEDMRNWYAIKLQVWHIWGWWIINMILYTSQDMHHLNLTHHSNKDVYSTKIAINTRFATKEIHAKTQPTRGWGQDKYARIRYLLPG